MSYFYWNENECMFTGRDAWENPGTGHHWVKVQLLVWLNQIMGQHNPLT